jgi:hypothetical protein
MSLTLVFQSKEFNPGGSGVVLRPDAKSSIKMPIALAVKALEDDPIQNRVCRMGPLNFLENHGQ